MNALLLLVDLQNDFLNSTGLQPPRENLTAKAAALLQGCRAANMPVVHIWTTISRGHDQRLPHWKKLKRWHCVTGTPGHETPPSLQPLKNELVIHKTGFNGFAGGELDKVLKKKRCDALIVAGVHLHTCVRAVAAESLERGLGVLVAEDAVASNDPILAAATRRWLAERCVEFLSINEILSRPGGKATTRRIHRSPRETKKVLFEIPSADMEEIATASLSAKATWQKWREKKISARCRILAVIATRLEALAPKLARQMAVEIGKPLSHGLEEVRRAAANVRDVIRRASVFKPVQREAAGLVRQESLGVIALISPWNNPVAIPVGKIAPALVYGNAVVWKPAPAATRISRVILKLLREAGVPDGTVQILTGDHAMAQALAANDNIDAVTITSSATAGYATQEICARRFLPLQAELSGNNAAIVWDDANLPVAAAQIAWGAFGFAGQRCTANRRVIVSEAIFENFWHELKVAAEKLRWGDPLNKATDIGPVIHLAKRDEHLALIELAKDSGAASRVEFLFSNVARQSWIKTGAYAQPVIVSCDEPGHPLVQEETMSPLLVVQRARDFDAALELCNGVRHGLAAALFSDSKILRQKFLAEARAGILKINSATAGVDVSLPFGGWKMSGYGPPEHGEGDRLFYTRMQAVYGTANQK
ncbi:MAG TPA: aldehyde dehydrogenase family protein [Pseudomonadales bacterium]|nr:aldehyde dehydrogenase family protein [Pseudomonadales bacterium]